MSEKKCACCDETARVYDNDRSVWVCDEHAIGSNALEIIELKLNLAALTAERDRYREALGCILRSWKLGIDAPASAINDWIALATKALEEGE